MPNMSRRSFLGSSAVAGLGIAAAGTLAKTATAEEVVNNAPVANVIKSVDTSKLMPEELGLEWNEYKATCGPLYPGYPHYDEYLTWVKDKLTEYGYTMQLSFTGNTFTKERAILQDILDNNIV